MLKEEPLLWQRLPRQEVPPKAQEDTPALALAVVVPVDTEGAPVRGPARHQEVKLAPPCNSQKSPSRCDADLQGAGAEGRFVAIVDADAEAEDGQRCGYVHFVVLPTWLKRARTIPYDMGLWTVPHVVLY